MGLRPVGAGLVAVALLLTGCDGGGRPRLRDDDGVSTDAPRKGGILRLGITRLPPRGLDPAQARTLEQLLVADQLYDTLTAYDPKTLEPVAGLAERWDVSPDQKQFDFHLKAGVAFANGRPIEAADVKYSLERVVRSPTESPNADLLELVSGYVAFRNGAAEFVGVSTPAPNVVRITTDEPFAALPSLVANPALGVVPREVVERTESPSFAEAPVGSGPFNYRGRTDRSVSLVRAPGSPAFVDGIELVQFADVGEAYEAFRAGDVDWSRVPPDEVPAAGERYGTDHFRPYVAELFYAFNLSNPKFADVRFREAIVRAIDRQAIVRAIYDDIVRPINGVVVEGVPGYQEDACGERCEYSPARAKELVAEVFGGGAPHEVMLDFDQDDVQEKVANAIKSNLGEIGVRVTLRPKALREYQDFAVTGQQEVFRLGWIGAFPSPDAFVGPLFKTNSPSNLARFSVPAVDEQLRAARAEPDAARRRELYQAVERAVMEQVPVVPIAQFQVHAVAAGRVRGLTSLVTGTFDASRVWLAGR